MTEEKQRIAIAEACGWTFHPPSFNPQPYSDDFKSEALACWVRPGNDPWQTEYPPDYLNDLNAIHPIIGKLDDQQWEKYRFIELGWIKHRDITLREPSAKQKCEALLKTFGKWEEDK